MQRDERPALAVAWTTGRELLKALGLEGQKVTSLRIEAEAGQPIRVVATMVVLEERGLAAVRAIEMHASLVDRVWGEETEVRVAGTPPAGP